MEFLTYTLVALRGIVLENLCARRHNLGSMMMSYKFGGLFRRERRVVLSCYLMIDFRSSFVLNLGCVCCSSRGWIVLIAVFKLNPFITALSNFAGFGRCYGNAFSTVVHSFEAGVGATLDTLQLLWRSERCWER